MCFSFFIAANSANGFVSLFDEITKYQDISKRYIIKGGPGSGKSSFMKKIAKKYEEKGYDIELLYCSSDPNSLDGIVCREAGISIVDGTAPHIIEPKLVGAIDNYINFSEFWDSDKLYMQKEYLQNLQNQISENYKSAYKFISCAKILKDEILDDAINQTDIKKLEKRVDGIIKNTIPKTNNNVAIIQKRFLRANSFKKDTELFETIDLLAKKVYSFEDNYGLASIALERISNALSKTGLFIYSCYSPLDTEKLEHIIIPSLSLAFSTNYKGKTYRKIHLDTYCNLKAKDTNEYDEIYDILMENANQNLKLSKELHDELEKPFIEAMDFSQVDKLKL